MFKNNLTVFILNIKLQCLTMTLSVCSEEKNAWHRANMRRMLEPLTSRKESERLTICSHKIIKLNRLMLLLLSRVKNILVYTLKKKSGFYIQIFHVKYFLIIYFLLFGYVLCEESRAIIIKTRLWKFWYIFKLWCSLIPFFLYWQ